MVKSMIKIVKPVVSTPPSFRYAQEKIPPEEEGQEAKEEEEGGGGEHSGGLPAE